MGCWIWFYILNYKIYDGNVCQLFAEGKEDFCSLSSLIIEPSAPQGCLEKFKYVKSKSITLAGLPSLPLLFSPPDSTLPAHDPGASCLDCCVAFTPTQTIWPTAAKISIS